VTGYGRVILYRNKGDGTFEDVTVKAGLKIPGWSIGAAWLDYDPMAAWICLSGAT